ncbi:myosin-11-like [Melospiza melodia melodia]|uniref:myosin-11-like n=1 Tax=Melospiza melodia melodia TaxID=1914991 RepID=UPI002FD5EB36
MPQESTKKPKHHIPFMPGLVVQQLKQKSPPGALGSSSPRAPQPVEKGGARGLSHQGRSSRAPEVLVDNGDSMANSIICTNIPGNILSTLTPTDEQHPFELAREATENCECMWQQFDQVEERTQRIRSQYQIIDSLLEEISSDCANFEKSKEMLLQCTGIPETGAFCLQQKNTMQQKEASSQEGEAEQQDRMEVSQEQESSSRCVEQLSQESSGQGHEVAQVGREEELLAQRADLEGRLAASEGLREDLSRQLAETRSAKESLQSRLAAAQQQISQLEISRKCVEAELQGELQAARREAQAAQRRHEEELRGLKEEMNRILEQREALQKREWTQWEEVAQQNSKLQASVNALEREKARLILSLEEKNVCLRTLEEQNLTLNNQASQCQSALQHAEQLSSNRAGQLRELKKQIQALQDAVLQMEASQATRQKQLLKDLEESHAGERSLRDSVHVLEAEVSELHCEAVEVELRKTQAQRDNLRAFNLELQKELEEIEQELVQAEAKHISHQIALEKEATERQEEAVALHQEVASLQKKLEKLEKERKDVLYERELYQQQMRNLEKENEMHAPEMRNHRENTQELELERDGMQEYLEHGAATLKKLRDSTQVLSAALSNSELAKGALKKHLNIVKRKTCIQAGTGIDFHSVPVSLNYSCDISHEEVSQEQESSSRCLEQLSQESSGQGHEVAQVGREEELLAQRADLEGRLAASEGLREDLSRQLAETRLAKESMQSRLCAAQQQIPQLEMSRKRVEAELQGDHQAARREVQAAQRRHNEDLQDLKEEMNLLLEQREALQKQVAELTSQLAASRECQERTVQRAQQDVREAQEESRQKLLEVEQMQKILEEAEHQKKDLQVHLEYLEREWSQWEEVAQQNSELQASVNALEREKARLILSLEEKNVCLRTLEEQNLVLKNQVSQCQSALQHAEQLFSNRAGQLLELNKQMQATLLAELEKREHQTNQEKQLLKAEVSELHVRLQSSDDKALALAIKYEAVEVELRKIQAQRDNLRACNLELRTELEEIEQELVQVEAEHISHQIALEKEATERQEEAVALHQEVAFLRTKLENLEKERKNMLGARGLSHQGRSSRAPEVLVDNGDSMDNSIIRTDNPGNILSTLTSTDEQHPFELAREATENCERMWQQFDQVEARTQRIRSQYQIIDSLLEEIRSDCANFEKSKEMLLQCTGIPETGAFCLQQKNTMQQKEASAQAEEAEQQDRMEVSQEQESSSQCLEQLSQESSGQGHEVAQVGREEELLAQKADLEGRLAASEGLREDLSRQLAETR